MRANGTLRALCEEFLTTVTALGTRGPSSADSVTKRATGALLTGGAGVREAGRTHDVGGVVPASAGMRGQEHGVQFPSPGTFAGPPLGQEAKAPSADDSATGRRQCYHYRLLRAPTAYATFLLEYGPCAALSTSPPQIAGDLLVGCARRRHNSCSPDGLISPSHPPEQRQLADGRQGLPSGYGVSMTAEPDTGPADLFFMGPG